jgi:hypothetical protein
MGGSLHRAFPAKGPSLRAKKASKTNDWGAALIHQIRQSGGTHIQQTMPAKGKSPACEVA